MDVLGLGAVNLIVQYQRTFLINLYAFQLRIIPPVPCFEIMSVLSQAFRITVYSLQFQLRGCGSVDQVQDPGLLGRTLQIHDRSGGNGRPRHLPGSGHGSGSGRSLRPGAFFHISIHIRSNRPIYRTGTVFHSGIYVTGSRAIRIRNLYRPAVILPFCFVKASARQLDTGYHILQVCQGSRLFPFKYQSISARYLPVCDLGSNAFIIIQSGNAFGRRIHLETAETVNRIRIILPAHFYIEIICPLQSLRYLKRDPAFCPCRAICSIKFLRFGSPSGFAVPCPLNAFVFIGSGIRKEIRIRTAVPGIFQIQYSTCLIRTTVFKFLFYGRPVGIIITFAGKLRSGKWLSAISRIFWRLNLFVDFTVQHGNCRNLHLGFRKRKIHGKTFYVHFLAIFVIYFHIPHCLSRKFQTNHIVQ